MSHGHWQTIAKRDDTFLNKKNQIETKLACILGYYKGKKYIKDQIQSIIDQNSDDISISLFISDDDSKEEFPSLSDLNLKKLGKVDIFYRNSKNNKGYTHNFLSALNLIDSSFDYYCFSDQDDIWNKDKIQRSILYLKSYKDHKPSLYFGRTNYFNENCTINLGKSTFFRKKPSFKNAIIQNMAGGNTMVFNKEAKKIISSPNFVDVVSHDWWCYQIISGVGGNVFYDSKPCLKYRQHKSNILGSNNKVSDRFIRFKKLLVGDFRDWNEKNIYALNKKRDFLTEKNKIVLDSFILARKSSFFKRIFLFYKTGIFRQNLLGNFALLIALFLKKI